MNMSSIMQHNLILSRKLSTAKGTSKQQNVEQKRQAPHKIYLTFSEDLRDKYLKSNTHRTHHIKIERQNGNSS
jgi:hypothetical protein